MIMYIPHRNKDLGHLWLGYIRMLGHLQMSAHLPKDWHGLAHLMIESKVLGLSLTCYKCYLDIGTMTIESVPLPFLSLRNESLHRGTHWSADGSDLRRQMNIMK